MIIVFLPQIMKKMKKILIAILTITSMSASAQTDEGVFFDLNFGGRFSGANSDSVTMAPGLHIEGATGYMFSNIVGIRGVLGFDSFKTAEDGSTEGVEDKSFMLRATLEGVLSVSQLADFGTEAFDLNLHAGFGFATQVNRSWKESRLATDGFEFEDPAFKGNDDMINVVFGLNPKYHINENISINADISYVILTMKDWTADRYSNTPVEGMDGILNGSIGLTYRL